MSYKSEKDFISEEIEAFCSLGPKACPVELDINSTRPESETNTFFRRLRLTVNFKDKEDVRDIEEKRFYTRKPDFIPDSRESVPLNILSSRKSLKTGNL